MTVLSDLGVLWRWSAEPGRSFTVERRDPCAYADRDWRVETADWFASAVRYHYGTTRGGALAAAARWARKQMGEGR